MERTKRWTSTEVQELEPSDVVQVLNAYEDSIKLKHSRDTVRRLVLGSFIFGCLIGLFFGMGLGALFTAPSAKALNELTDTINALTSEPVP